MSEKEFRKYNSAGKYVFHHLRVTGDPKVINEGFVKIPSVITSAGQNDADIWVDIIPPEAGAHVASFLKKGDTVSGEGFLTLEKWGDNGDKISHSLKNARLELSPDFVKKLKDERGYDPSQRAVPKKGAVKKIAGKSPRREIQIPEEDE